MMLKMGGYDNQEFAACAVVFNFAVLKIFANRICLLAI